MDLERRCTVRIYYNNFIQILKTNFELKCTLGEGRELVTQVAEKRRKKYVRFLF